MKKILTVLAILAIVVGSVFAATATTDKLVLTSDVDEVKPTIKFIGNTDKEGSTNGTALGVETSIADDTIVVDFTIKQYNENKADGAARYNKVITFDITVGPLTQAEADKGSATTVYKVAGHIIDLEVADAEEKSGYEGTGSGTEATAVAKVANKIANTISTAVADNPTDKNSTAQVKSTYSGRVVNQDIATFKGVWYQDTRVPSGTYTADITITYTIG